MNRSQLAFLLSGLGIFVFGCEAARESSESSAAAASLSARDEYLASKAFAELPPDVASAARATLDAAGTLGTHALVGLYSSAKFIQFAAVQDSSTCTQGSTAALVIVTWAQGAIAPVARETADKADPRFAGQVDALGTRLADPNVDVTKIDETLKTIGCGATSTNDAGVSHCSKTLFAAPACDDTSSEGTSFSSTSSTTPFAPAITPPHAMMMRDATEQHAQLASFFSQADVTPSNGMKLEWEDLRTRWNAGLSHVQRETLRNARRRGSNTVSRDVGAAARFDEASKLVDAMVRGKIAPTSDAMNLVHASVATENRGHLRVAGENVSMGRNTGRRYLAGAAVQTATNATFAKVSEMRANGEATPLVAAAFDQQMISIHPYMDANGRTTRLMTDWMLMRGGFPPALVNQASRAAVIMPGRSGFDRDARLEHITVGMRRTVALLDQLA